MIGFIYYIYRDIDVDYNAYFMQKFLPSRLIISNIIPKFAP